MELAKPQDCKATKTLLNTDQNLHKTAEIVRKGVDIQIRNHREATNRKL